MPRLVLRVDKAVCMFCLIREDYFSLCNPTNPEVSSFHFKQLNMFMTFYFASCKYYLFYIAFKMTFNSLNFLLQFLRLILIVPKGNSNLCIFKLFPIKNQSNFC